MPVDSRGFNRRYIEVAYTGTLHHLKLDFFHGPAGYTLRRYIPSLEIFGILAGLCYILGYELPSWMTMLGGVALPLARNKLKEQRLNRPYSLLVFMEGFWQTNQPILLYFTICYSPRAVAWAHSHLVIFWGTRSSVFQISFTVCVAGFIAGCIKMWTESQRKLQSSEEFDYRECQLGSDSTLGPHIRLLRIQRWLPWAGVRSSLISVPITATGPYEAISYTWGNSIRSHTMLVNGSPFKTTAATYNALKSCSSWWQRKVIWIDYVCINQSDDNEKSSQVALMKEIYSVAAKVVIWLAKPLKPAGWPRVLESIFRHVKDEHVAAEMVEELAELISYYGFSGQDISRVMNREDRSHRAYRLVALSDFLANPWFSRIWIVQEIAVARELSFRYENEHLDWDSVWNVMNSFQEPEMAAALAASGSRERTELINTQHFHQLARIRTDTIKIRELQRDLLLDVLTGRPIERSSHRAVNLLPLTLLLAECAGFDATDPRDKVYALLGLSSDNSKQFIKPDYENHDTKDVYTEVARYVLDTEEPLALLPFAGIGYRTSKSTPNLPSWVADWSSPPSPSALDQPLHNHYLKMRYLASLSSNPFVSLDANKKIVTLGGGIVDQILTLAPVCHFPPIEEGPVDNYNSGFHPSQNARMLMWHDETFRVALGATNLRGAFEEVFWRTLIGDITPSSRPAPVRLGDDYRKWITSMRIVHDYHEQEGLGVLIPQDLSPASPEFAIWGSALGICAVNRKLCVTNSGYLGMVPQGSRVGDVVAIIMGAKTPYVLRRCETGKKDTFEIVGECYVDGMMDGEMMGKLPRMEHLAIV